MAYIKTLFKKFFNNIEDGEENSQIYPVTVTNAVFDQNNKSLEELLLEMSDTLKETQVKLSRMMFFTSEETLDLQWIADNSSSVTINYDNPRLRLEINFIGIDYYGAFMWNYAHSTLTDIRKYKLDTLTVGNKTYSFNCGKFSWDETFPITVPESITHTTEIESIGKIFGPSLVKPSQTLTLYISINPENNEQGI